VSYAPVVTLNDLLALVDREGVHVTLSPAEPGRVSVRVDFQQRWMAQTLKLDDLGDAVVQLVRYLKAPPTPEAPA
jgi:hypothetical protein